MVFPHPHKFCQIAGMQTFVHPIPRHSYFSMPPVTFYPVCTGIIVAINEFFGIVNVISTVFESKDKPTQMTKQSFTIVDFITYRKSIHFELICKDVHN